MATGWEFTKNPPTHSKLYPKHFLRRYNWIHRVSGQCLEHFKPRNLYHPLMKKKHHPPPAQDRDVLGQSRAGIDPRELWRVRWEPLAVWRWRAVGVGSSMKFPWCLGDLMFHGYQHNINPLVNIYIAMESHWVWEFAVFCEENSRFL